MSGSRKCCCCTCADGTEIKADGTVEWITHTVDSGVITVVDNEAPCKTYWVESAAGDQNETGTGTEDDPWININTVFGTSVGFDVDVVACIKYICSNQDAPERCPKVKVLVKGTIDYTVDGNSYDYERNLIFEPWDVERFEVDVSSTGVVVAILSCVGVIWKNVDVLVETTTANIGDICYGFGLCTYSTFDNSTSTATSTADSVGIHGCNYSTINNFTSTGTSVSASMGGGAIGINSCTDSTFKNVSGIASITSSVTIGTGWGIARCDRSEFDTCIGTGTGASTKVGPASAGSGIGFVNCDDSILYNCSGTGTGSSLGAAASGYGFNGNSNSTFASSHGIGATAGTPTSERGCGFFSNSGASIPTPSNTTSAKICVGAGCPGVLTCDI